MNQKNLTVYIIVAIVGVVGLLTIAGIIYSNISSQKSSTNNSETSLTSSPTLADTLTSTPTSNSNLESTPTSTSSTYKNGSYTVNQSYFVEGVNEAIKVTLTVENDTVTAMTNSYVANDRQSEPYQQSFESQIKSKVVGKKLSDISSLSRVGGASFTTRAFNQAISSIKSQASV